MAVKQDHVGFSEVMVLNLMSLWHGFGEDSYEIIAANEFKLFELI
jgi:hypothetical protein